MIIYLHLYQINLEIYKFDFQNNVFELNKTMKIKLKTIQNTENESDDEEDKSIIKVEENRVYFHADVTRENCIKLIESLQKAQEYIARNLNSMESSEKSILINAIHNSLVKGNLPKNIF